MSGSKSSKSAILWVITASLLLGLFLPVLALDSGPAAQATTTTSSWLSAAAIKAKVGLVWQWIKGETAKLFQSREGEIVVEKLSLKQKLSGELAETKQSIAELWQSLKLKLGIK